jgi:hypothetical protein
MQMRHIFDDDFHTICLRRIEGFVRRKIRGLKKHGEDSITELPHEKYG